MAVITVNQFSGVSPMTPPRYLQDNQAQTALNCPAWLGSLTPLRGVTTTALNTDGSFSKTGDIESIYRFGQSSSSELNYWFHWTEEVDVVQGFINGDTTERTYYTLNDGTSLPKVTNSALALTGSGTEYPIASYDLGVPKPGATGFSTAKTGTGNTDEPAETRVYTFTYVNSFDEESAPYSATDMSAMTEDVYPGESVVVTLPTSYSGSGNYNITKKRIYRSASGTVDTSFLFVAEIPLSQATYTDSLDGDELNEAIPSLTWEQAPTGLKGLVGLSNGVMVGFKGNDVYFSEPFRPFAWPVQYTQTVGFPIVGLGVMDTTVVVLTEGRPFFLQGSHPDSMVMVEADINQACLSKRSIVSINGAVYYASPDGLVKLSTSGSGVATQSMFDKYSWQTLNPDGMIGMKYENQYIGFFTDVAASNGGFILDTLANTWNFHNVYATAGYNDLKNDALYVVVDNKLKKWDTGSALTYTWKSKKFTTPEPKSFSCYRVQGEYGSAITVKVYKDGTLFHTESVSDGNLKRLPSGLGTTWEFQLEGATEVYNVQLAQSPMELNAQ